MDRKKANASLQLDVDTMILEFLIYTATKSLLEECRQRQAASQDHTKADNRLRLVDGEQIVFGLLRKGIS